LKTNNIKFVGIGFAVCAICGIVFFWFPAGPVYNGRTSDQWIDELAEASEPFDRERVDGAVLAIQNFGLDAMPQIVERLGDGSSWTSGKYRKLHPNLPPWIRENVPKHAPLLSWEQAAKALAKFGTNGISLLLESAKNSDVNVRRAVASALSIIVVRDKVNSDLMVGSLISFLEDEDARIRLTAARALGRIGPPAASAVPALALLLRDSEQGSEPGSIVRVRSFAAMSLGKLGPVAAGALPQLNEMMSGQDVEQRIIAADSVWQISGDREKPAEALLNTVPGADSRMVAKILKLIKQMNGPENVSVSPLLDWWERSIVRIGQTPDRYTKFVTKDVAEFIADADPETAAKSGIVEWLKEFHE